MLERALDFIKSHGTTIRDQKGFLEENNWTVLPTRKSRKDNQKLHYKIIKSFLEKIKFIESQAGEELKKSKKAISFVKELVKEIENYTERCNSYFSLERWVDYEDVDDQVEEMDFQNEVLSSLIEAQEQLAKIDLNEVKSDVKVETWGDFAFPIPMRSVIEERYPDIVSFLNSRREKQNGDI